MKHCTCPSLQAARQGGIKVFSFTELEAEGSKKIVQPEPPSASDLSTIMYTSGTTGVWVSAADSCMQCRLPRKVVVRISSATSSCKLSVI